MDSWIERCLAFEDSINDVNHFSHAGDNDLLSGFTIFSIPLFAGDFIKPESIQGKQELCISDGSSIYIFSPDKTFRLEPIGMSGRTIKGTWTSDSDGIHIVGQWSWINGISTNDDFREMDIHIGSLQDNIQDQTSKLTASKHKIYECYFLI